MYQEAITRILNADRLLIGEVICYQHEFVNNLPTFRLNAPVVIRVIVKELQTNAITKILNADKLLSRKVICY